MRVFVVDTNVLIAANGRRTHADLQCQLACVRRLKSLINHKQEAVAIDDKDRILDEYRRHMKFGGGPMGDEFFMHVHNNLHNDSQVLVVPVTPSENDSRGFEELPDNTFDRSDRKFLAVAVVAKAAVLNATDSDWGEQAILMNDLGIEVDQLCPQHASK